MLQSLRAIHHFIDGVSGAAISRGGEAQMAPSGRTIRAKISMMSLKLRKAVNRIKARGRLAMVNFWDKNPRDTEPGYYGLAKRNVETGGETLLIVTTLPVMYATVAQLAIEHDQAELRLDPNSDYRYFVVELTEQEIAAHIARHAGS
jgi:hypothetical protein